MDNKHKFILLLCAAFSLVSCTTADKKLVNDNKQINALLKVIPNNETDLNKAQRPDQYYEIGRQYQKNGSYSNAVIAYQKSLQLDPSYTKSIAGLATVFADQKLYNISIALFEQVTKLEPNAVNYNNLGYAYFLSNQYAEASRVLAQAILLEPNYLQAQKNLQLVAKNQLTVNSELTQQENNTVTNINQAVNLEDVNTGKVVETSKLNYPASEPQLVRQDLKINVVETQAEFKMIQTASGIYELGIQRPTVKTATKEYIYEPQAHKQSINSLNIFKDLSASISGGITFKYTPALNKLFDLASSGISNLVANDNTKFVEIVNGNGIKGFARAVANKMQVNGNAQLKVSDAKRFNKMRTHIQYRSGYRDAAVSLNQNLLNKPYLVRNDNLPSDVAIRLVLGRDLLQQSNKSAMTNLHPEEEAS